MRCCPAWQRGHSHVLYCLWDPAAAQTSSAVDAGRDVGRGSFQGLAARHWHWPHANCQKVCQSTVSLKQGTHESPHDSVFPGCLCSHAFCTHESHAAFLSTISFPFLQSLALCKPQRKPFRGRKSVTVSSIMINWVQ